MFSFGLEIYRSNKNIVFHDVVTDTKLKLYYDELLEIQVLLSAVNKKEANNIVTKLSSHTNVSISRTKSEVNLTVGGLDLRVSIGQSKSLEHMISKLLTFWPLTVMQTSQSGISKVVLNEIKKPVVKEKVSKTTEKPKEEYTEEQSNKEFDEIGNSSIQTTEKSEMGLTDSIKIQKTNTNKLSKNTIIELVSVILSTTTEIPSDLLKQLTEEVNKSLGTNYPFNYDVIKTIIETTKQIVTNKGIDLNQYRNVTSENDNSVLKDLWSISQEATTEQDKRLAIASYYFIQQLIGVNEFLGDL